MVKGTTPAWSAQELPTMGSPRIAASISLGRGARLGVAAEAMAVRKKAEEAKIQVFFMRLILLGVVGSPLVGTGA